MHHVHERSDLFTGLCEDRWWLLWERQVSGFSTLNPNVMKNHKLVVPVTNKKEEIVTYGIRRSQIGLIATGARSKHPAGCSCYYASYGVICFRISMLFLVDVTDINYCPLIIIGHSLQTYDCQWNFLLEIQHMASAPDLDTSTMPLLGVEKVSASDWLTENSE